MSEKMYSISEYVSFPEDSSAIFASLLII